MMNSILALLSPRKQSRPPASPDEPHKKAKTYSKKDRIRAQRALARISNGSDVQSEPSRLSIGSTTRAPAEENQEAVIQSQPATTGDEDIYDATPEPSSTKKSTRRRSQTAKRASGAGSPKAQAEAEVEAKGDEEDHRPQEGFTQFLGHRWVGDTNIIEIRVEWEKGQPTWEFERHLHEDALEFLLAYWRDQGGRPPNPIDPELYDIFAVRKHSRNKKKVCVEWVGFGKKDMSWLATSVVKDTAPELLDEYWKSIASKKKA